MSNTHPRVSAHRANVDRYRRLLRTRLEPYERQYLLRRLAEEEAALERLAAGNISSINIRKQTSKSSFSQKDPVNVMSNAYQDPSQSIEVPAEFEELLHPASAFDHPMDVVRDPDLTTYEKRAILSSWASDACAVESAPSIRRTSSGVTVTFDDIIDALRSLDVRPRAKSKPRGSIQRRKTTPNADDGGVGLQ